MPVQLIWVRNHTQHNILVAEGVIGTTETTTLDECSSGVGDKQHEQRILHGISFRVTDALSKHQW
jgi:hypothetical protein